MVKKENDKIIPKRNYFYLGLIIIFSLMVIYYCYLWYQSYRESLLYTPILSDEYLNVIQFNEIDDYIMENKDAVIYVSVLGNENIQEFELKFANVVQSYSLRDYLLYMDVSDYEKGEVDSKFSTDFEYPYLVVYTNGKVTNIYSIADNGFSTKKMIKYLNRIGVIEDD